MTARTTEDSTLSIILRCETYATSSAVTQSDRREAFEQAATRLRALDAENARLRAELDAFRKRYEPHTCKHCNQSTAHPSKVCAACWGM